MWLNRKINFFEKVLVLTGFFAILIGYLLIQGPVMAEGITLNSLQVIFLWLILVVLIIIAAINENMKEELKIVVANQSKEMRLLREDLRRK
jgi:hypothetical protein